VGAIHGEGAIIDRCLSHWHRLRLLVAALIVVVLGILDLGNISICKRQRQAGSCPALTT
jgi:hypothetical protein